MATWAYVHGMLQVAFIIDWRLLSVLFCCSCCKRSAFRRSVALWWNSADPGQFYQSCSITARIHRHGMCIVCVCVCSMCFYRWGLLGSHVPAGLAIEVVLSHRVMRYFTESQWLLQSFTQSEGTKNELEITNWAQRGQPPASLGSGPVGILWC